MKKLLALLMIPVLALSFASCTVNKKNGDGKKDTAEKTTVNAASDKKDGNKTTVDYSNVLKELNRKEKKFVDSLGVTEKGKKIVAFFGDDFETQFIVAEFKDGKISLVKNYRFFKEESKYNAYKIIAESTNLGFVDHEEAKCIEQTETKKYRGKTYDDMIELLHGYDYKY